MQYSKRAVKPQVRFQLVIPQHLKDQVEKVAASKGISMGSYIKEAVVSHLAREEQS